MEILIRLMNKKMQMGNNIIVPEKYSPIANEEKTSLKLNPPIPLLGRVERPFIHFKKI